MASLKLTATITIVIEVAAILLTQTAIGQLNATTNISQTISSRGTITAPIVSNITVTPSRITGINNLTLGTQLTFQDMETYPNDKQGQALMNDANIKLVRIFDADFDTIGTPLVLAWNEKTHTGTYNWTVVDPVINAIYSSGAEPLIDLMSNMATSASDGTTVFANGMENNTTFSGLPSPEDAASYASAWVTHMQAVGYPVRYYEVGNEIYTWLFQDTNGAWQDPLNAQEQVLAANFAAIYNATVTAMKRIAPTVSVSFDFSWFHGMMSWWLANYTGTPLDRIDFHNYAENTANIHNDSKLFQMAQTLTDTNGGTGFWSGSNPVIAQQMYYNAKNVVLPLFDTESGLDAQWSPNTDPIIVQMNGAVFTALVLKTEALCNVQAHIYYDWQASLNYQQSLSPPSYGFGLIDGDNHQPWYPYYVYLMMGKNLQVGDPIVYSTNSGSVVSFTWMNNQQLNILLINSLNVTVSTTVFGVAGNFSYEKIDNTYSFQNAKLQTGTLSLSSPIIMNGYTVMLLTLEP